MGPVGGQVIDVGANETEILQQLNWFGHRAALDVRYILPQAGIQTIVTDFRDYQPESEFDLVLAFRYWSTCKSPRCSPKSS